MDLKSKRSIEAGWVVYNLKLENTNYNWGHLKAAELGCAEEETEETNLQTTVSKPFQFIRLEFDLMAIESGGHSLNFKV